MRARHLAGRKGLHLKGEMDSGHHGLKRGGRVHHLGEGKSSKERHDRKVRGRAKGGGNWIQGAIKHPGSLHRALHVPEGEKIPAKKLAKAAKSKSPSLRRKVVLARTLSHLHH